MLYTRLLCFFVLFATFAYSAHGQDQDREFSGAVLEVTAENPTPVWEFWTENREALSGYDGFIKKDEDGRLVKTDKFFANEVAFSNPELFEKITRRSGSFYENLRNGDMLVVKLWLNSGVWIDRISDQENWYFAKNADPKRVTEESSDLENIEITESSEKKCLCPEESESIAYDWKVNTSSTSQDMLQDSMRALQDSLDSLISRIESDQTVGRGNKAHTTENQERSLIRESMQTIIGTQNVKNIEANNAQSSVLPYLYFILSITCLFLWTDYGAKFWNEKIMGRKRKSLQKLYRRPH